MIWHVNGLLIGFGQLFVLFFVSKNDATRRVFGDPPRSHTPLVLAFCPIDAVLLEPRSLSLVSVTVGVEESASTPVWSIWFDVVSASCH